MGWQSRDHGVIGFDEDEGGASVLLLLPGAPLQSGERLARESFAGAAAICDKPCSACGGIA